MKYRKKPVVIEAYQMTLLGAEDKEAFPPWLKEASEKKWTDMGAVYWLGGVVYVQTREGTMEVSLDDWIIQGIKGELYPCKPDIFEATYEPVDEADETADG